MNLIIAAASGWGKSHTAQEKLEKNLPDVDFAAIFDHDDEYRGIVKAGLAKWYIAGPNEVDIPVDEWVRIFLTNKKLVIARYLIDSDEWRTIIAKIYLAFNRIYQYAGGKFKFLFAIDEAHDAAPQETAFPEEIGKIAVAGRGEMMSTIWITQRLAMLDKDIVGQCNARYLGGFQEKNDLDALPVGYPKEVHNTEVEVVPNLPDELKTPDGEPIPLRKWADESGKPIGSEWIYSNDLGERRRDDRRQTNMSTTHYGFAGYRLDI